MRGVALPLLLATFLFAQETVPADTTDTLNAPADTSQVVPVPSETPAETVPVPPDTTETTVPVPEETTVPVPAPETVPLPAPAPVESPLLPTPTQGPTTYRPTLELPPSEPIEMEAGFARVFYSPTPLRRVYVGNDELLISEVVTPNEVMIIPKKVGVSNVIFETEEGERFEFQIRVRPSTARTHSKRAVALQVYVVEVRQNTLKKLGFQWATDTAFSSFSPAIGEGKLPIPGLTEIGPIVRLTPFTLKALAELNEGDARLLAAPTLVALEDDASSFHVGGTFIVNTSGVVGGQIQRVKYGVSLTFTPHIDVDQSLVINLNVEVSEPDFVRSVQGIPSLRVRTSKAVIRARSGEVVGIGGLLFRENQVAVTGVPFLSKIPLIGHLFKSRVVNASYSDLVILMIPTLLPRQKNLVRIWESDRVVTLELPVREVNGTLLVPVRPLIQRLGGAFRETEQELTVSYRGRKLVYNLETQTVQFGEEVRSGMVENYFGIWQIPLSDLQMLVGKDVAFLWDRYQNVLHVLKGVPKP